MDSSKSFPNQNFWYPASSSRSANVEEYLMNESPSPLPTTTPAPLRPDESFDSLSELEVNVLDELLALGPSDQEVLETEYILDMFPYDDDMLNIDDILPFSSPQAGFAVGTSDQIQPENRTQDINERLAFASNSIINQPENNISGNEITIVFPLDDNDASDGQIHIFKNVDLETYLLTTKTMRDEPITEKRQCSNTPIFNASSLQIPASDSYGDSHVNYGSEGSSENSSNRFSKESPTNGAVVFNGPNFSLTKNDPAPSSPNSNSHQAITETSSSLTDANKVLRRSLRISRTPIRFDPSRSPPRRRSRNKAKKSTKGKKLNKNGKRKEPKRQLDLQDLFLWNLGLRRSAQIENNKEGRLVAAQAAIKQQNKVKRRYRTN